MIFLHIQFWNRQFQKLDLKLTSRIHFLQKEYFQNRKIQKLILDREITSEIIYSENVYNDASFFETDNSRNYF